MSSVKPTVCTKKIQINIQSIIFFPSFISPPLLLPVLNFLVQEGAADLDRQASSDELDQVVQVCRQTDALCTQFAEPVAVVVRAGGAGAGLHYEVVVHLAAFVDFKVIQDFDYEHQIVEFDQVDRVDQDW